VIAGYSSADVIMEVVDLFAPGKMEDKKLSVGFKGFGQVTESGGFILKMGKTVKAQDNIKVFFTEKIPADVRPLKFGGNSFGPSRFEHLRGKVDGPDSAGMNLIGQPLGNLAGPAPDFQKEQSWF
jgi:hypothetical protein